jgi:hypothetical protein
MSHESARRFTICLDDEADTVTIERPSGTIDPATGVGSVIDTYPYTINFPTGPVRVIFQDASYNPVKHGGTSSALTWHFDDIMIGG